MTRAILLYAKARWSDALHPFFWQYAMRIAVHIMNHQSDEADGIEVQAKIKHFTLLNVQCMH